MLQLVKKIGVGNKALHTLQAATTLNDTKNECHYIIGKKYEKLGISSYIYIYIHLFKRYLLNGYSYLSIYSVLIY